MSQGSELIFNRLNDHYRETHKIAEPNELLELFSHCTREEIIEGVNKFDQLLDKQHENELHRLPPDHGTVRGTEGC